MLWILLTQNSKEHCCFLLTKPQWSGYNKVAFKTHLCADRWLLLSFCLPRGECRGFVIHDWCVFFFFSAGFCEGARAAASAGPAPSGGTAQDHTAAALVPQHALQEAVPELKASGSNHTGRWWCLISSLITICKSCRCSSGCSWSIWGLKSVPLC